jgi:CheY-like chemotaxis protein
VITAQSNIEKSDSCIVVGPRQSGKLTLALLLLQAAGCQRISVVSPFTQAVVSRRLSLIEGVFPADSYDFTCLKPDWKELKREFGYDFVLRDLERIIEAASGDAILLHRIDEFFEIQDRGHVGGFISLLSNMARERGKKLLLTFQNGHGADRIFLEHVEKHLDLELGIEKDSENPLQRNISIQYSVMPAFSHGFMMQRTERGYQLEYDADSRESTNEHKPVLLVTDDERTIKRLRYLLRSPKCRLEVVMPELSAIVPKIMSRPDLVIVYGDEQRITEIGNLARESQLPLLVISDAPYVRKLDKLKASQKGVTDLLEREYFLEDLVLAIERGLRTTVYDFDFNIIPNKTHYVEQRELFDKPISLYVEKGFYFTIYTFKLDVLSSELKDQILSSRPYDYVYFDEEQGLLRLFATNMLAHNAGLFEEKVRSISPAAKLLSAMEACEFYTSESSQAGTEQE